MTEVAGEPVPYSTEGFAALSQTLPTFNGVPWQALRSSEQMTSALQHTLAQQRQAYEKEYALLTQTELSLLRQKERERLRLDLHDRLSQSMRTTLAQLAEGRIGTPQVSDMLQQCFSDTRLVIESLEPVGHDVDTLIGTMRPRFERHLRQQGIDLQWCPGMVSPLPWLEAPQCLMLLRWVQDAGAVLAAKQALSTITLMTHQTQTHITVVIRATPTATATTAATTATPHAEPGETLSMPPDAALQTWATLLGGTLTASQEEESHQEFRLALPRERVCGIHMAHEKPPLQPNQKTPPP